MPEERIVATGIYYLKVDGESFLEFRKPTLINEIYVDYPQCDDAFTRHHYGVEGHFDGVMNKNLGFIKCKEDSFVVFPNSLQHRVREYKCAKRTIIVFFLIDSEVVGTHNTYIDEKDWEDKRDKLMFERKYFVDELNNKVFEREFSLCEH